jgi:hypothetical protein
VRDPVLHPHHRPLPARGRGEEGADLREQTVSLEASRLLLLAGKETLLLANERAGSAERALPSPLRGGVGGGGQLARTCEAESSRGRTA